MGRGIVPRSGGSDCRCAAKQLRAFEEQWPTHDIDFLRGTNLGAVPQGEIRPTFGSWWHRDEQSEISLRALLYAHSVIVDEDLLHPLLRLERPYLTGEVQSAMRWLATAKPLVMDGSILFTSKVRGVHPSRSVSVGRRLSEDPVIREATADVNVSLISGNLLLATEGTGTPLALSHGQEVAYGHLLNGHAVDDRVSRLSTLARIGVPDYRASAALLVNLRQNEAVFADWRGQLLSALSAVSEMPDGDVSAGEAAAVVTSALEDATDALTRSAPPALASLAGGTKGFVLTGLGAVAGAALSDGNPTGALVGAGITGGGDLVWEYLRAVLERRRARTVRDVILSFH